MKRDSNTTDPAIAANTLLSVVWSWYNFPAFLFHELSHFLFIGLFFIWVKIDGVFWKVNITNTKFLEWNCKISYSTKPFLAIIISSAPVFMWLIAYVFLLCFNFWVLALYFAPGMMMAFSLSEMDRVAISENWSRIRLNNR